MSINIWGLRDGYKRIPTDDDHDDSNIITYIDNKLPIDIRYSIDESMPAEVANRPFKPTISINRYLFHFTPELARNACDYSFHDNKLVDIRNPENPKDAVNKEYCDNNKKSKNYVAYIPYNLHSCGFLIASRFTARNSNLLNMFDNNFDTAWTSQSSTANSFSISCPEPVILRKIFIDYSVKQDDSTSRLNETDLNFFVWRYTTDNIDFIGSQIEELYGGSSDNRTYRIPYTESSNRVLNNRTKTIIYTGMININEIYEPIKNYAFEFILTNGQNTVNIKAFQLYVYND